MSPSFGVDLNLAAERAYPTPLANSAILPLLLLSLARQKHTPDTSRSIEKEYDYVIVGAGSAGSVVASRLSEVPCVNVLLLEAGKAPPRINEVVAYNRDFLLTDLDWQYYTVPQKNTGRGLRNRQVTWSSGKAIGGSSILSAGNYGRGNRWDYDEWASMGAKGWSYEEVLPYFKKMEDNKDHEYIANGYHGVGGPVTVMKPSYYPQIKGAVFRAAQSMGYKIVDPNARRQTGFYDLQDMARDNQRCSAAKAYLVPAENRTNLDILPNAMVEKVIISKRRATGVQFSHQGRTYKVRAKREVIMSAGAVKTAQLLMLSGIGPKRELQRFNIPVHADLPVGKNLQDHAGTAVNFALSPYIKSFTEKISDPENVKQFINSRKGPLASPEGIFSIAFLYNDQVNPKKDYPNYELYFFEGNVTGFQEQWNMKREVYNRVLKPYENEPTMICMVHPLHPRSRGTVTLRSANPHDEPMIDPQYLEDSSDLDDLVEGLKTCKRIGTSPQLRKLGSRPFETLYPGCEKFAHDEDRYYRCQAKSVLATFGHYCGTAKMGDPKDPTTVVDPKLRVKGIKGLRVVDNSIAPTIISGNPGAPAIMIGEKASDIIKESIQCKGGEDNDDYDYDSPDEIPSDVESEDDDYDSEEADSDLIPYRENENEGYDEDYEEEYDSSYSPQSKGGYNRKYRFPNADNDRNIEFGDFDYFTILQNRNNNNKNTLLSSRGINSNKNIWPRNPSVESYEKIEFSKNPTNVFEEYKERTKPKFWGDSIDGINSKIGISDWYSRILNDRKQSQY